MELEIERKFLVNNNVFIKEAYKDKKIIQGFLSSVPERSVRIRIIGKKGFLTVKGLGNTSGTTRYEWEKEISLNDATDLLKICEPGIIDKTRHYVNSGNHTFEVDVFYGENKGLVIAEIELSSEEERFKKPNWLGNEITGIIKYYNSSLASKPYSRW